MRDPAQRLSPAQGVDGLTQSTRFRAPAGRIDLRLRRRHFDQQWNGDKDQRQSGDQLDHHQVQRQQRQRHGENDDIQGGGADHHRQRRFRAHPFPVHAIGDGCSAVDAHPQRRAHQKTLEHRPEGVARGRQVLPRHRQQRHHDHRKTQAEKHAVLVGVQPVDEGQHELRQPLGNLLRQKPGVEAETILQHQIAPHQRLLVQCRIARSEPEVAGQTRQQCREQEKTFVVKESIDGHSDAGLLILILTLSETAVRSDT